MLDERWGEDEAALATGLAEVLAGVCGTDAVRAAEAADDGRDPDVEQALDRFGLWDLPGDVGLDAVAAWELGRALAPVPFVETVPVRRVLDLDAAFAPRGWAPAACASAVVGDGGALQLVPVTGPARRTSAGDLLVQVGAGDSASEVVGDAAVADRLARLIWLIDAARLVGAAEAALEVAVAYASEREQFGRPIGSFQAIAHRLVDARTAVDGAGLLVRKATWLAAEVGDGAPPVPFPAMVRWKAVTAARLVAATVHQTLGGYGFALEHDGQLYSRRIRAWILRLPRPEDGLVDVARQLLDPARRDAVPWLWHHERGAPRPRWAVELDDRGLG
ncbi:MAG: hypothetical protein KY469_20720 [Actinobacteria bacterium]|nr:hypothetical protein [Actinomycetota bacterium]